MTFRLQEGTFGGPMRRRLAVAFALVALPEAMLAGEGFASPVPAVAPPTAAVASSAPSAAPAPAVTLRAWPPPAPAGAPSPSPLVRWNPAWRPFHPAEYVATGTFVAAGIASLFIEPDRAQSWGRNDFDEAGREAFRLKSPSDRFTVRAVSDVLLFSALVFPFVVDALAVARGAHGRSDVAWQMALMDVEAFSLTVALQVFVSAVAGRERPYGRRCGEPYEGLPAADCEGRRRYLSFYSGHTSAVFTSAGLTCAHHQHLPLYGGGAADVAACGAAVAVALTTATFRVMADEHYTSDVLVGSVIGLAAGYGLPTLLHYRGGSSGAKEPRAGTLAVSGGPTPLGLSLCGTFY